MIPRLPTPWLALAACLFGPITAPAAEPAVQAPPQQARETIRKFQVETSDGAAIAAWCYPLAEEATPVAIVILVHDLGGTHASLEPLARALQAAGCVVVAPDLRGHGDSTLAGMQKAPDDPARILKKSDFDMMAASRGGQKRDQSALRGDVECVRNWIRLQIEEGGLPKAPLFVVGSGLGATVAAYWTVADALWPDLASGPQGREVAGLVLISPAFATKGFSLNAALANEPLRRTLPTVIIAGADDRDALQVFDRMKPQRPKEWFDIRKPKETKNGSPSSAAEASLLLVAHPAAKSGDELAVTRSTDPRGRSMDPVASIPGFIQVRTRAAQ